MQHGTMKRVRAWALGLLVVLILAGGAILWTGRSEGALVAAPGGSFIMGSREAGPDAVPTEVEVGRFLIGRHEVTVREYVEYLNDNPSPSYGPTPQITMRGERYCTRKGRGRQPVAWVSHEEARAFCAWLSKKQGQHVRLPTEAEWEYAARGGIKGARYPWGWGAPEGRARFDADGPVRVGSYDPNPFGLHDMAGNVFEWCAADDSASPGDEAVARGGSWAERDPQLLKVYRRTRFPRGYRDADVGFRIVVEVEDGS